MHYFNFRQKLAFGAPEGDIVGQMAISILCDLQGLQGKSYPIISFKLSEEYNDGILVAFFTISGEAKKMGLHCAAHKFYLKEPVSLITPLIVGCHSKAANDRDKFKKMVIGIANAYCCWAMIGFPIYLENGFFPPWGERPKGQYPGHETNRVKDFEIWQEAVNNYLNKNTLL